MKKRAASKRVGTRGGKPARENFVEKWAGKLKMKTPEELARRGILKEVLDAWIAEDERDAERFWRKAGLKPGK